MSTFQNWALTDCQHNINNMLTIRLELLTFCLVCNPFRDDEKIFSGNSWLIMMMRKNARSGDKLLFIYFEIIQYKGCFKLSLRHEILKKKISPWKTKGIKTKLMSNNLLYLSLFSKWSRYCICSEWLGTW